MARMRGVALGAGYGAAAGMNKFLEDFFRQQDVRRNQEQTNQNITEREALGRQDVAARENESQTMGLAPQLSSGALKPDALTEGSRAILSKRYNMDKLVPTDADQTNKVVAGFSKAGSLSDLPTQEEAVAGQQAATHPIRPPGMPAFLPGQASDNSAQQEDVGNLIKTLRARNSREDTLQMQVPSKPIRQFDEKTGQETEHYVPENQLAGVTSQLGRTNQGEATRQGGITGAEEDAKLDPTRVKGRVREAGQTAGAQAAAQAPYKSPDILYDKEQGDAHAFRFGPGGAQELTLPPGMGGKTPPKPLTAGQVDQLASIGTAETEGVKILQQLKQLGLDKSNDPMDPRWQKFVVGTLGMAPGDFAKADIQQRTAFVNAKVLSNMMKGRPSKYLAELYQQHTPKGEQTGMQLSHVLNNVLGQGVSTREELANYTGHKMPEPSSGTTFQQWNEMINNVDQGPQQPPPANQDLSPSLAGRLNRGR